MCGNGLTTAVASGAHTVAVTTKPSTTLTEPANLLLGMCCPLAGSGTG